MPELPEVETMRRGIAPVIGCRVRQVEIVPCELKPIQIGPSPAEFCRRAHGRTIVGTGRIGKRVTVLLDNDDTIVFEPRMTGLLVITDPPNQKHCRLRLVLSGGSVEEMWFWDRRGLGSVRLLRGEELRQQLHERLGPDALQVNAAQLQKRLGRSRREIKVALLDQDAIAGIGNLYASEMLHVAGIDPRKKCHLMPAPMWRQLHRAMRNVLNDAIRYEGSTLGDGTYRNALNRDGTYQNHHRVYMRHGSECPTCGEARIRRILQAQRSTFFCPACQKKRPSS